MPLPLPHPADRVPPLPAGRAAAVCLLTVGLLLGAAEAFWRALGWRPSVTDSPALRGWYFDRALAGGPETVALLGGSRMQLGFDPQTFEERFPRRPLANLAIDGTAGGEVLRELSEAGFGGTVLISFAADHLECGAVAASRSAAAEIIVASGGEKLDARLTAPLQGVVVAQ